MFLNYFFLVFAENSVPNENERDGRHWKTKKKSPSKVKSLNLLDFQRLAYFNDEFHVKFFFNPEPILKIFIFNRGFVNEIFISWNI